MGQCYKEIILIDYFAKEIKFSIFKYKIGIWNEQAKKTTLKWNEKYCFYNFDLEVTNLDEKNEFTLHLKPNSRIEMAPKFKINLQNICLLRNEISQVFFGCVNNFPYELCERRK